MKTRRSKTRKLPKPFKFVFFLIGIALICLPNWIALKAVRPLEDPTDGMAELTLLTEAEEEPELELQDWMYSFEAFDLVAVNEEEIELEEWMLDFAAIPRFAVLQEYRPQKSDPGIKPYSDEWFDKFMESGFQMASYRSRQR
jgi:hypothetical protein